jgi:hypothetical protein
MDVTDGTPGDYPSSDVRGFGPFESHVLLTGSGIVVGCAVIGLLIGAAGSGDAGVAALIAAGLGAVIAIAVLGVAVVKSM